MFTLKVKYGSATNSGPPGSRPTQRTNSGSHAIGKAHLHPAREVERQMEYEPGLVWLCGDNPINHHTLSDFRVAHKEALDELFEWVLTILNEGGVINIDQVMHDGPKQMVVDGGYISQSNIVEMEKQGVELIGPLPDRNAKRSAGIDPAFSVQFFILGQDNKTLQCPARSKSKKRENEYPVYRAEGSGCQSCEFQKSAVRESRRMAVAWRCWSREISRWNASGKRWNFLRPFKDVKPDILTIR